VIDSGPFNEFKLLITTRTRTWRIGRDVANIAKVVDIVELPFPHGLNPDRLELIVDPKPGGYLKLILTDSRVGPHPAGSVFGPETEELALDCEKGASLSAQIAGLLSREWAPRLIEADHTTPDRDFPIFFRRFDCLTSMDSSVEDRG
jgi:hypothetical protein